MSSSSDFYPDAGNAEVPPEVMQFVQEHPQPPSRCTECSACGTRLDSFRYVCSTCGEKTPKTYSLSPLNGKGKAKDGSTADPFRDPFSYPPSGYRTPKPTRPLPSLPSMDALRGSSSKSVSSNGSSSSSGSASSTTLAGGETGYELCPNCFQTEAIVHALEVSSATEAEPASPNSEYARSQRHRKAPQKGQFRHAFQEKVWGVDGWKDVGE